MYRRRLLLASAIAFHGSFKNAFALPDSDTQCATDLLKASSLANRATAAGGPCGAGRRKAQHAGATRCDHGDRRRRQEAGVRQPHDLTVHPDSGALAESGRIGYADIQFAKAAFELDGQKVVDFQDSARETASKAGLQVEFTGSAESPPPEQGTSELVGIGVAFIVLIFLFRALIPVFIPLVFAIVALAAAATLLALGSSRSTASRHFSCR